MPSQEEISTTPLVPHKDDEPLAESLPYTVDDDPEDITAEQEEALLDPEAPEPEPPRKKKKASSSSADRPLGRTLLYGSHKPDDEEPPSMV